MNTKTRKIFLIFSTLTAAALLILFIIWATSLIINLIPKDPAKTLELNTLTTSTIGGTTESELDQKYPSVTSSTSGELSEYKIRTQDNLPLTEILTKDGIVVSEKLFIPENEQMEGYTTLPEITSQYGAPNTTIQGSKTYGDDLMFYIYHTKGFAALASPINGGVMYVQFFKPTTLEQYLSEYGSDVDLSAPAQKAE